MPQAQQILRCCPKTKLCTECHVTLELVADEAELNYGVKSRGNWYQFTTGES